MADGLTPEQLASLRPLVTAIVEETLRSAGLDGGGRGLSISTGTIASTDGPDIYVIPDDDPDDEFQATRAVSAHTEGARVFVLHYPPSGALVLPAVPDPT